MAKGDEVKKAWVEWSLDKLTPIRFHGALLYRSNKGFLPLGRRQLADSMYASDMSLKPSVIDHVFDTLQSIAPDWSEHDRYIAFHDQVWDMVELDFNPHQVSFVYSSMTKVSRSTGPVMTFLLELALGDEDLANDYLQAMAPLFMKRRPSGVIWFVGDGANGKSSLIDALYRILGDHFASMTIAAIEDGRDTPRLNGILGNIVRESSEGRVEDSERYKAIGTHEPFTVHKFHSQDQITVDTDFHTIFNGNNVPVFSDKTKGARRRTLIVPFKAHFKDDPTFDDRTFTPEFLGGMVYLIMEAAKVIRDNGYRFKWSDATLRAKEAYDSEVNSAEAFVSFLVQSGIVGFTNYSMLRINYENWCAHHGLVPLGVTTLKRTLTQETGPMRKSVRNDAGKTVNRYFFAEAFDEDLTWLDNGYGVAVPSDEVPAEPEPINEKISRDW